MQTKLPQVSRILIGISLFSFFLCAAQPSKVLYQQNVQRVDGSFFESFHKRRGIIYLTEDSIVFKINEINYTKKNFSISYLQVRAIKRTTTILPPNIIKIKSADGITYKIFTYKRWKLISVARRRMRLN